MRCPTCHKPIRWVPRPDGVRVAIGVETVPDGDVVVGADGLVRPWRSNLRSDVPRYATHVPCPEAT